MRRFIVGAFRGKKRRKAQAELRASIYWGVLACYIKEASPYTTTYGDHNRSGHFNRDETISITKYVQYESAFDSFY